MQNNQKLHVAFIVDGNGRWAKERNKPRTYGHRVGIKRVKELIEKLKDNQDIGYVSFYIFSLENWKRDNKEINFLFKYLNQYLDDIINGEKINFKFVWTGFEDNLSKNLIKKIKDVVFLTKDNDGLVINFVFNYGGVQEIVYVANKLKNSSKEITYDLFKENLLSANNVPEVNLLIRTSGEKRISNYLLFLSSYAEFIFEPTKWPDYTYEIFLQNLSEYKNRDIRKGGYGEKSTK